MCGTVEPPTTLPLTGPMEETPCVQLACGHQFDRCRRRSGRASTHTVAQRLSTNPREPLEAMAHA
jgi:hypothetical protein